MVVVFEFDIVLNGGRTKVRVSVIGEFAHQVFCRGGNKIHEARLDFTQYAVANHGQEIFGFVAGGKDVREKAVNYGLNCGGLGNGFKRGALFNALHYTIFYLVFPFVQCGLQGNRAEDVVLDDVFISTGKMYAVVANKQFGLWDIIILVLA